MANFNPLDYEEDMAKFWDKQQIYAKVQEKNKAKQKFYFLDGPPYTSGKVHIGTAWNKSLKDAILRFKRMRGLNVIDRAGYDMHGLPTENATEKKLKLKSKDDIPKMGVDKFVKACKDLSISNLKDMNKDFQRLGVWMDFENAYQTVAREYIDGEWWLVKTANEKGRLYEGFRAMAWDWSAETAAAKHELEYKNKVDTSIFVKMQIKDKPNEFLVIWTTTPWTIAFNLGIMMHPEFEYVKCKVEHDGKEEFWFVAKALANVFLSSVAGKKFEIVEEVLGDKLEGTEYIHPFTDVLGEYYSKLKSEAPKVHTVVMSEEFVDTTAGTGLVHMAPGCGPEDYEVGYRNGIPAWNLVKENGYYPDKMGEFSGRHAVHDNKTFIDDLEKRGALVAKTEVEHEYPHAQRSHEPVIFRTTKQWFFKIEDLKEKMIEENNKINWVPQAGYNAFNSWLNNLRDNSISKQRYWGTPLPIWRNVDNPDDYIVVGSIKELEELSGQKVDEPHIPWIDNIDIKKDGKTYKRVPDVLDVWVDAGTASWNSLNFPQNQEEFDKYFPADFILEGKDQIRGWFNLLHVASMVAFEKPCFKAVYMHGYVQDAQGRKMSKSQGNYILPEEVIKDYGADALRYYMIGGANAGVDINYNFDDLKTKFKNMSVLWNVHNYLMDLASTLEKKDITLHEDRLGLEEKYILSRLQTTIKKVTELYDAFVLDKIPGEIESLFLELSRTYLQLTRDKSSGTEEEKQTVCAVTAHVMLETLKMFSTIAPFVSEKMYLNLKEVFSYEAESIHLCDWPVVDEKRVNVDLEQSMDIASSLIQASLGAREKMQRGVRWPVSKVLVLTTDDAVKKALPTVEPLIRNQVNVKVVETIEKLDGLKYSLKPVYNRIAQVAGAETQQIAQAVMKEDAEKVITAIQNDGKFVVEHNGQSYNVVKDCIEIKRDVPDEYAEGEFKQGLVYLEKAMTPELEAEGFARELMRRVQDARKKEGLQKNDVIKLHLKVPKNLKLDADAIKDRVGASEITVSDKEGKGKHSSEHKIKGKVFGVYF
jgi:isoleucyl-tRNA synthetase